MRWLDGITNSIGISLSKLGVGDGQGGLACCNSLGRKESDIKLITETQQTQTNKLVWSPETQKAFKVLHTAFLQAPTLSLPTGSAFASLLKKKGWGRIP